MGRSGVLASTTDSLQRKLEQLRPQAQTPQPQLLAQATPGQSSDPVTQFQQNLQHTAITRLQNNKTRLNTEQSQYQDINNTEKWVGLKHLALKDDTLRQHVVTTTTTLEKFINDTTHSKPGAAAIGLTVGDPNISFEERRQRVTQYFNSQSKDPQQRAHVQQLLDQIDLLEDTRNQLQVVHPALGGIDTQELGHSQEILNPAYRQHILSQMTGNFDNIRSSIDSLSERLKTDPSSALFLDRIVKDTLKQSEVTDKNRQAGDPKSKAVLAWVEQQHNKDNAIKTGGMLVTGGLALSAFLAPEFSVPLWKGAAVTAVGTGLYELPEQIAQNLAAESAQIGGQKLTSKTTEETRYNLAMGYANVVLGGLDAGLAPETIVRLRQLPELRKMIPNISREGMESLGTAYKLWTEGKWEQAQQWLSKMNDSYQKYGPEVFKDLKKGFDRMMSGGQGRLVTEGGYLRVEEEAGARLNQPTRMQGTSAEQLVERQTLLKQHPVLSGYSDATNRLLAAKPGVVDRLMKVNPQVLRSVLADSKLLDQAAQQVEVVNNFIGKKWDKLSAAQKDQLKQFYTDYTTDKGTLVLGQRRDVGLQIHVNEKGVIVEGFSRKVSDLRISTDQMRKVLKDSGVPILKDHSIHHKLPIAMGENDPLAKGAIELSGFDINDARNLEQMPRNSAARGESPKSKLLPEHGQDNYHPKWSAHTKEVLRKKLENLRKDYKIPGSLSPEEAVKLIESKDPGILKKTMEDVIKGLDKNLLKDGKWIQHNDKGERVLAFIEPQSLQAEQPA